MSSWWWLLRNDLWYSVANDVGRWSFKEGFYKVYLLDFLLKVQFLLELWFRWLLSSWWFQRFFIFTPIWGNDPIWLIFFNWVETTNQLCYFSGLYGPASRWQPWCCDLLKIISLAVTSWDDRPCNWIIMFKVIASSCFAFYTVCSLLGTRELTYPTEKEEENHRDPATFNRDVLIPWSVSLTI